MCATRGLDTRGDITSLRERYRADVIYMYQLKLAKASLCLYTYVLSEGGEREWTRKRERVCARVLYSIL